MYYAQINLPSRVCFAVTETHSPVDAPHMIEVKGLFSDLIGKRHDENTGEFLPQDQPSASRTVTREAFLRLLTQAERIALRTAAKTDPYMEDFMHLLDATPEVDKDDPDVALGLGYAETRGYIDHGRTEEILA